jgi:preprotein translocase subunit SecG
MLLARHRFCRQQGKTYSLGLAEWAAYSLFAFTSRAKRNALKRCMFWTAAAWRAPSIFIASFISASRR